MSTFRGVVAEFPYIRIDFFRAIKDVRPPLACFLSHVHSDHLAGLESLKSPFVYCSAATKEILLRLERYPHRLNFAKGILESRKQTYKHLKNLLKPIPLETPTVLELSPGKEIQVTLFDANHCTGAVMFLIEDASQAILYTGDIRSEPCFVSKLTRSPFMVEYASGFKTLDCIYLDTSNAGRPEEFPPKSEGLAELLQKVSQYPQGTTFHFSAWTYGYEEVWMALAKVLKSPIHVDKYKMGVYKSLRGSVTHEKEYTGPAISSEGSVLAGYKCGNNEYPGILTGDQTVRLHSCEKGTECAAIREREIVWIQPIVCRNATHEVAEVGIGGGGEDLTQNPELELDHDDIVQLLQRLQQVEQSVVDKIHRKLLKGLNSSLHSLSLGDADLHHAQNEFSLSHLAKFLIRSVICKDEEPGKDAGAGSTVNIGLPKTITFPYSRHSSHSELCDLIKAFRPADVYPCTVDNESWHEGISIEHLFGKYCSKSVFRHDGEMRDLHQSRYPENDEEMVDSQSRASQASSPMSMRSPSPNPLLLDGTKLTSKNGNSSPQARVHHHATQRRGSVLSLHTLLSNREGTATETPSSATQKRLREAVDEYVVAVETKRAHLSGVSEGDESGRCKPSFLRSPDNGFRASREHLPNSVNPNPQQTDNEEPEQDEVISIFYDQPEGVFRCGKCGWELWVPTGSCVVCEAGEYAYEEYIAPVKAESEEPAVDAGVPTNLTYNIMEIGTDNEADPAIRAYLRAHYLDYASSAYSDEENEEANEYLMGEPDPESTKEEHELRRMIDDEPIDLDDDSVASDNDENEDTVYWKARYGVLQREYDALVSRHEGMRQSYGKESESGSEGEGGEMNVEGYESGEVDVEVSAPPVLAEIFLNVTPPPPLVIPAVDSDQMILSDVSDDLADVMSEAEHIAGRNISSPLGRGPQDLRLLSTSNNHRFASPEL